MCQERHDRPDLATASPGNRHGCGSVDADMDAPLANGLVRCSDIALPVAVATAISFSSGAASSSPSGTGSTCALSDDDAVPEATSRGERDDAKVARRAACASRAGGKRRSDLLRSLVVGCLVRVVCQMIAKQVSMVGRWTLTSSPLVVTWPLTKVWPSPAALTRMVT